VEETKQIVAIIESESRPRSLKSYVSRMPDSQMTAVLARIRSGEAVTGLTVQRDAPPDALRRPRKENRGATFREHGMHAMRHFFASVLLTEGESPKAVAEWMGHTDGGVLLLKTYAHLMEKSVRRMRRVIDGALRRPDSAANGPQTAQEIN
jgi:integrase